MGLLAIEGPQQDSLRAARNLSINALRRENATRFVAAQDRGQVYAGRIMPANVFTVAGQQGLAERGVHARKPPSPGTGAPAGCQFTSV